MKLGLPPIRQSQTVVECYVLHSYGLAYVHDCLDTIISQIDKCQATCTVKVTYVNVHHHVSLSDRLTFDLISDAPIQSSLDCMYTNMQLQYETFCTVRNINPKYY